MAGKVGTGRLAVWFLMILLLPLISSPPIQAVDQVPTKNERMAKQLEAYQSQQHLVKAVQKRLDVFGYSPGPMDGILGPKTRAALMAFQKDNGLVADGVIGLETLRLLDLVRHMD